MNNNDLTILFLSCDKYADLWKPLFYCVYKYFNQNEYPIYVGSNTLSYKDKKITTLLSGKDKDWSTSLLRILNQIQTPYIFLWLDDMFPISKIDTTRFSDVLHFMIEHKAKHIHVIPQPKPDQIINGLYGTYEKKAPYRVTAFGFWEVETLKNLLLPGESPWSFEIMGSYRSSYNDGFYCLMKPLFTRLHVIEKGKIFSDAYTYCMTQKIPLDTGKRKILENKSFFRSEMQKIYFNAVIKVPWKIRLSIMDILRKLLISY